MTGTRMGNVEMGCGGRRKGARGAKRALGALLSASLLVPAGLVAQSATVTPDPAEAEAAAVAVITGLFDAMRESDAETMRGLFADEVGGFPSSYVNQQNTPVIRYGSLDGFLDSVAAAEPGSLDEQFIVRDVIVDDNLVTVVTPYTFTYQGEFSHCGVDVFLIARQGQDWRIAGLADTRRRGGCEGWLDE